jgi:hypothetical protein
MFEKLVALMMKNNDPQAMERLDRAMESMATRETDPVAREILAGLREALAARNGVLDRPLTKYPYKAAPGSTQGNDRAPNVKEVL